MVKWANVVLDGQGPFYRTKPGVCVLDSYGPHESAPFMLALKQFNMKRVLVPKNFTGYLQPLDVCVMKPFKSAMEREWDKWMRNSTPIFTAHNNRQKPAYQVLAITPNPHLPHVACTIVRVQVIVDMVSAAVASLNRDVVKKAFKCCGIASDGQTVPDEQLHRRLQALMTSSLDDDDEVAIPFDLRGSFV